MQLLRLRPLRLRSLRRALVAVATIVSTTAIIVATTASPAAADSSQCTPSGCAGKANFVSYGEHLKVTDALGDGHSAVAMYWLEGGTGPFHVWNPNGNGTTVDHNMELPEGSWIFYKVCLGEYGPRDVLETTCSAGTTDYA